MNTNETIYIRDVSLLMTNSNNEKLDVLLKETNVKLTNNKIFQVERLVTFPLPHRPVRADFPHTIPVKSVSLNY